MSDADADVTGEELAEGLKQLVNKKAPSDEHWCPICEQYAEFRELQPVKRLEYGVKNTVLGCPDCPHTMIDANRWERIEDGEADE